MTQTLNYFSPFCQSASANVCHSMSSNQRPTNRQASSLQVSPHHNSNRNRKRKFIQLFDDDENGRKLHAQCLNDGPPKKRHIASTTSDKNEHDVVVDALDRTLSHLTVKQSKSKLCKKRSFAELSECKDCMNDHDCDSELELPLKKMKLDNFVEMKHDESKRETALQHVRVQSELIPDEILFAELVSVNDDHKNALIRKLSHCACDSVLHRTTRLNQYSGALVPYKKPIARQSWQDLVQTYYEKNNGNDIDRDTNDAEMKNNARKKRPIRLHSSYAGYANDTSMSAQQSKNMANQCYVSGARHSNDSNRKIESTESQHDDGMECD